MVDLVKIRKKAKKLVTEALTGPEPTPEPAPAPEPAAEASAPASDAPVPQAQTATSKLERFKQDAGKRRVTTGTASAATAQPSAVLELLTFVMAGEQYAVDIERIVEIVTPRPVTRIPNADGSVVGIVSLRGTIVTLLDVRGKLRHKHAGPANADTRIVVVDYHNETVGFVVDRVLRVVKAATEDIEPPPVVHVSELDDSVRGVFRVSGALTILLDLDKLLDSRALAAIVA
jgi:chemotaxis signal transduction protein